MRSFTRPPQAAARKHFINAHASAQPAAEAISGKGRPQRRSVKNRRPFDCFKSAEGIRFSADAVADPEIVSPRRFFGYLLSEQKVTYEKIIERLRLAESCGPQPRRAEARNSLYARLCPPQSAARKLSHYDVCGSLSRAVRSPSRRTATCRWLVRVLRRRRTAARGRYASCREQSGDIKGLSGPNNVVLKT